MNPPRVSIEAGGNSPFIVFGDADIDDAVEGQPLPAEVSLTQGLTEIAGAIVCKFRGSGQTCICANRIYVHSSVYAEFASRLAEKVAAFKIGDGLLSDMYAPPPTTRPRSLDLYVITAPTDLLSTRGLCPKSRNT